MSEPSKVAEFSPGPWMILWQHYEGDPPPSETYPISIVTVTNGFVVADFAECSYPAGSHRREVADASLISAAPELYALAKRYEALEAMMVLSDHQWFDNMPDDIYDEMMACQALRNAAVEKAEGRQS